MNTGYLSSRTFLLSSLIQLPSISCRNSNYQATRLTRIAYLKEKAMLRIRIKWVLTLICLWFPFGCATTQQQQEQASTEENGTTSEEDSGEAESSNESQSLNNDLGESNELGGDSSLDTGGDGSLNAAGEISDLNDAMNELGQSANTLGQLDNKAPPSGNEMGNSFGNLSGGTQTVPSAANTSTMPIDNTAGQGMEKVVRYIVADGISAFSQPADNSQVIGTYFQGDAVVVTLQGEWAMVAEGRYIKISDLSDTLVPRVQDPNQWKSKADASSQQMPGT